MTLPVFMNASAWSSHNSVNVIHKARNMYLLPNVSNITMAMSIKRKLEQCVSMRGPAVRKEPQYNLAKAWQDWMRNCEECLAVEREVTDPTEGNGCKYSEG